jgi:hypothetical protein
MKGREKNMYDDFIKKAKLQDSRNEFGKLESVEQYDIPETLHDFYKSANPIDVEVIREDFTAIKFYPVSSLGHLQTEYDLPETNFVFASREGDPIMINNGKIYTAIHGDGDWEVSILSSSFDRFIKSII